MRGGPVVALSIVTLVALSGLATPLSTLSFSTPVKLNPFGAGYEPGIDVDSQGTLYATAHKASLLIEGTRLSSWLWYSTDDGASWHEMPSPAQAHDKLFAFEGDLAVDALDRLYYVDTLLADSTISRWSPGPSWDYSLPLQRTSLIDDRPWLAAHGDGIVYYVGNNGVGTAPSPEHLLEGQLRQGRGTFYRSLDGGLTWSLGESLPYSGWCNLDASPLDDVTVYTICASDTAPQWINVQESHDRGQTFVNKRISTSAGSNFGYPSIGIDRDGNVFGAWSDSRAGVPSKLMVGRQLGGDGAAWETLQVPTTVGTISRPWLDVGSGGVVAIGYYGTDRTPTNGTSQWRTYVAVSANADAPTPTWETAEVSGVIATGGSAPADFMQAVVGPDDKVHVVFAKTIAAPDLAHVVDYNQDLYYTGQVAGPNLG